MPRRETRAGSGIPRGPVAWLASGALLAALGFAATTPVTHGAARLALRLAAAMKSVPRKAAPPPPIRATGKAFGGTPAVGALFSATASGGLGSHFCTASVVHSPQGDLAITAAHCVTGHAGTIDFVPGYTGGNAPYGVWRVTRIVVDQAWSASASPDDDVAFLVLRQPGTGLRIEDVTGAELLGVGQPDSLPVQVIGYPDSEDLPVTCQGRTSEPLPHQLEFDCRRYTNGTSGGPFLLHVNPATGDGAVIGVIGGYEQGGDLPQISYAAAFGKDVAALYQEAIRQG